MIEVGKTYTFFSNNEKNNKYNGKQFKVIEVFNEELDIQKFYEIQEVEEGWVMVIDEDSLFDNIDVFIPDLDKMLVKYKELCDPNLDNTTKEYSDKFDEFFKIFFNSYKNHYAYMPPQLLVDNFANTFYPELIPSTPYELNEAIKKAAEETDFTNFNGAFTMSRQYSLDYYGNRGVKITIDINAEPDENTIPLFFPVDNMDINDFNTLMFYDTNAEFDPSNFEALPYDEEEEDYEE